MTKHYENFPVASIALPERFRRPVGLIYAFARQADDFADEGERPDEERIALLDGFRAELDKISKGLRPEAALFVELGQVIRQYHLPIEPFFDLLDAFSQDVVQKRYADFEALSNYCRKSANPVGRLLLALYGNDSEENRTLSDKICSSLQLINFLQDVAIDLKMGRIYLPQDEMTSYGISDIESGGPARAAFMKYQAKRARTMMLEGAPLAGKMRGRLSLEMKMIIFGGLRILEKLEENHWDVFLDRPKLGKRDWLIIVCRALFRNFDANPA